MSHPIWMTRGRKLAEAFAGKELSSGAVISLGRVEFGWSGDETRNVMAAMEGKLLIEKAGYWKVLGVPSTRAVAMVPKKKLAPRTTKTDSLDATMIRFESIACSCGEHTFHRVHGGYKCISCSAHYADWHALTRPRAGAPADAPTELAAASKES